MFTTLIQDAKRAGGDAAKFVGVGVLVGVLAAIALFFFTLAAFVWAEKEYGTVAAGLGLGIFFLTLAVLTVIAMRLRRSRARQEQSRARQEQPLLSEDERFASNPQWWISPVAIATGIEVLRIIGAKRLVPAFALSAVVLAALQAAPRAKDKADQANKTAESK